MNKHSRQAGFGHIVPIALVVLVFAVIGFIGFRLYAHPVAGGTNVATQPSNTPAALGVPAAPAINSKADLTKAASALDQVDPNASSDADLSSLNVQLDF